MLQSLVAVFSVEIFYCGNKLRRILDKRLSLRQQLQEHVDINFEMSACCFTDIPVSHLYNGADFVDKAVTVFMGILSSVVKETRVAAGRHPKGTTRAVRSVYSHVEYLENQSRVFEVTGQPVRGQLTVHP